jgi:stearoyl-CoA 9-desaturase NADPH oxidoreductase
MPETGAPPNVHPVQRRVLKALSALTSPLLIDDYLELINPLWSTRELRGRIEHINHETEDAATVLIKPGYRWSGHKPGQYLRIGLDIEGVRHWRAYSLTSDPWREDGLISITVKNVDEGKVSPYLVRRGRPGTIVGLGGVEGDFILPEQPPQKLLFISAGSGITPIMSMLRYLGHNHDLNDVVLLHSARHTDDVIFGPDLRKLDKHHEGFRLHEQLTTEHGRMGPNDLEKLCEDWREREAFMSGPGDWWPGRRPGSISPTVVARGSATPASGSFAPAGCGIFATGRSTARMARWSGRASARRRVQSKSIFNLTRGEPWCPQPQPRTVIAPTAMWRSTHRRTRCTG